MPWRARCESIFSLRTLYFFFIIMVAPFLAPTDSVLSHVKVSFFTTLRRFYLREINAGSLQRILLETGATNYRGPTTTNPSSLQRGNRTTWGSPDTEG
ncbi:unnamed protein product [Ixodes pacificus]